ncbi:MAG: hypothetical protein HRT74_02350 [Flavobacteriales bacterium]|nr:hypothetical protein [Flavobacteriales bacterium]
MSEAKKLILDLIEERSTLKQDVYEKTKESFEDLKQVLNKKVMFLQENFNEKDDRLEFYIQEKGDHEAEVKVAGDVLIFQMHTNVFQFDRSHSVWNSSYLKENELNGYVGMINVYNFLADSFKFQRKHDIGYLIARIFINHEGHFLVQGKRQLGYLFNDFLNSIISREKLSDVVDSALIYTLGFDLFTPPYQEVQQVTVGQIEAFSQNLNMATGKRLGFKFSYEDDVE